MRTNSRARPAVGSPALKRHRRPAWLEVSKSALAFNCRNIKKKLGREVQLVAMVKANAYGHGAVECSKIFLKNGASRLGVAIAEEGMELRQAGITAPILVVYPEGLGREDLILKFNLEQVVSDIKFVRSLSRQAVRQKKTAGIYIKLDSGMGRYGLTPPECLELARQISQLPKLKFRGLLSHFSTAFTKDKTYSHQELEKFRNTVKMLENEGIAVPIKSIANSSAVLDLPEAYFNQARVGILIYGIYPSPENLRSVAVRPAATLKARIAFLKKVPTGTPISYYRTFHAQKDSLIATVPLGYSDGYHFSLSNKGKALLKGKAVPVVGRICMDTLMLDVTEVANPKVGDEVVFFGSQNGSRISLEQVAGAAGSISYDIVTRLSRRVPIIYTK
ncbi:MAG: alanine racemase [candidate division Zixibacteria bacterium]|nr:alanine racemase [candidate division Zixibacteria bacterium]